LGVNLQEWINPDLTNFSKLKNAQIRINVKLGNGYQGVPTSPITSKLGQMGVNLIIKDPNKEGLNQGIK